MFINKENDYYFDIWDHSHSIDFDWQGDKVSSSDYEEFKDIYTELCAISLSQFDPLDNNYDPQCNIDDIEDIRRVAIENGLEQFGVANVGHRPTVNGTRTQLEVHIFNFSQDIYGKHLTIAFCKKIRDEKKFDSFDALKNQIQLDAEKAKEHFDIIV